MALLVVRRVLGPAMRDHMRNGDGAQAKARISAGRRFTPSRPPRAQSAASAALLLLSSSGSRAAGSRSRQAVIMVTPAARTRRDSARPPPRRAASLAAARVPCNEPTGSPSVPVRRARRVAEFRGASRPCKLATRSASSSTRSARRRRRNSTPLYHSTGAHAIDRSLAELHCVGGLSAHDSRSWTFTGPPLCHDPLDAPPLPAARAGGRPNHAAALRRPARRKSFHVTTPFAQGFQSTHARSASTDRRRGRPDLKRSRR